MKKIKIAMLAALAFLAIGSYGAGRSSGSTNSIEKVLGKATVSRLEALASQRRLQSRTVTNGVMICTYVQNGRSWSVTNRTFSATGYAQTPRYSKLKLYVALSRIGKWQALKEWLQTQEYEGMNAWEAFSLAQNLSADNEMFNLWVGRAKEALGVDDETIQAILKASEN